ncbi:MAG: carboxypeptidase regulatory-like domain-containing protein, partial [Actinobacteria bacterium]|nr:carboxypeptidase regulatory-like domain-containing protein [Actinomycetota bacterium]
MATALLATGMVIAAPAASAADATITGTVVDDQGAQIGGGRVSLFEPEPGVMPVYADVAADGTFSVSAPAGPYYLLAIPPEGSALATSNPVDVADSTETAGTYALESTVALTVTTVTGTVTDEDGNPIEGAMVLAMDASGMGGGGGGGDMGDGGDMGGGGG